MKVKFRYNLASDARNWSRIISSKDKSNNASWEYMVKGIDKKLINKILKSGRDEGNKIAEDYLKQKNKYRKDVVKLSLDSLSEAWAKREVLFFKALEKFLNQKIITKNYQADLTTMYFSPYDWQTNWFMFSFWNALPKQLTYIAHEIFHIEFIKSYNPLLKKFNLDENKKRYIIESLTCLLNTDQFKGILISPDQGYDKHKDLREYIMKRYKKQKDIKKLLENTINNFKDSV